MKLKKVNAVLSLLSVLLLFAHLGYSVYAYFTFSFDPTLTKALANLTRILICLHAILGMCLVFLMGDGTRLAGYTRPNLQTVLQRVTAALLFPLLLPHVNHFALLQNASENGQTFIIVLVIAAEVLFFADVILHVAVSFSRALITLGWLQKPRTQKILDRIVWVLCALAFLLSILSVTRTELVLFLH